MSNNEGNSRVKIGVIQYAANKINSCDKEQLEGIKTITSVNRAVDDAILAYEAEKDSIKGTSNNPIVTAEEIRADVEEGLYR